MIEVCAHIGNVIRMAAIVDLDEVDAAFECVVSGELQGKLLAPTHLADTLEVSDTNSMLLDAFREFRLKIERVAEQMNPTSEQNL